MNRYQVLALATCLTLLTAAPGYADDRNHDRRWDRDRQEHRSERDRHDERRNFGSNHDERRWRDDDRDDRRSKNWFRDNGYSRLSIPARYYPALGQCRIWYPNLPAWRQPAARRNCGAAPRGAWLIRHPGHDARHVHVVVNEPWSYGPQLIGEFEIASGTFIRLLADF